jgi:hypothetical protein
MDRICEFDKFGICVRHKVRHEGIYYKLSQSDAKEGVDFRKRWDKLVKENIILDECNCNKKKGRLY